MSYDVRFWGIRKRAGRRLPYQVRWTVDGRQKAESFLTRALAESFRAELIKAARDGEPFDPVSGLPESRANDVTWFQHACDYVEMKWTRAAAKSRKSRAEALTTVTVALLAGKRGRPADDVIRRALYGWAFGPERRAGKEPPDDIADALAWIARASRPVSALRDLGVVREVLDALTRRLDGAPAAATTVYPEAGGVLQRAGLGCGAQAAAVQPGRPGAVECAGDRGGGGPAGGGEPRAGPGAVALGLEGWPPR